MNLTKLKDNFEGKALGAVGLATAAFAMPSATAQAQDAPQVTNVAYQPSAMTKAAIWSEKNPLGVGVAVRFGTVKQLTSEQVETVLRREFHANGIDSVQFFYEQNDTPGTGFTFHVGGDLIGGVRSIGDVRANVPRAADQVRLRRDNPVFALNQ
ncbi:hypothetical protein [Novosphingobium beihaiensis]|uniref:Uncharacterized protein n=1 Tax=Novosphingobium beihaiensis TaxID=2930389 RepID=A0ABT0BS43_9SPHN|nr:hypothetical protein [Novosphingobium beihaiensis]MCJ2187888.1 hypothetical protein [Novosphingobium beihaiensis]